MDWVGNGEVRWKRGDRFSQFSHMNVTWYTLMPQYQPTAPTSLHTASAGSETQLRQGRRWLHFETLCGHFGISKASRKEGVGKSCHLLSTTFCVIINMGKHKAPTLQLSKQSVCEPSQRCITCTCCFLCKGQRPIVDTCANEAIPQWGNLRAWLWLSCCCFPLVGIFK